jgi:hypothetical protein
MFIKQDCVRLVKDANDKDNLNYERKKTHKCSKIFPGLQMGRTFFPKISTRQRGLKHFRDEIL